jgi:hypothetical protein
MRIENNETQLKKACWTMQESLQPYANVTVERDWHVSKCGERSISSEQGRQIDESAEHEKNESNSMRER